jgi:hypothetical protein
MNTRASQSWPYAYLTHCGSEPTLSQKKAVCIRRCIRRCPDDAQQVVERCKASETHLPTQLNGSSTLAPRGVVHGNEADERQTRFIQRAQAAAGGLRERLVGQC